MSHEYNNIICEYFIINSREHLIVLALIYNTCHNCMIEETRVCDYEVIAADSFYAEYSIWIAFGYVHYTYNGNNA